MCASGSLTGTTLQILRKDFAFWIASEPAPAYCKLVHQQLQAKCMAGSYGQIKARIRALEAEAEQLRRHELRQVLAEMRQKIRDYGITPDQLFGPDLSDLVRYRHPETGATWNGMGRPPNWIKGKDRGPFRVG